MNYELVVQIIVYLWIANSFARIFLGLCGTEKSKNYGLWDTFIGILTLIVIFFWIW